MSTHDIAMKYWSQGRFDEAATLEEKVLERAIEMGGQSHPDSLRTMNRLALVYKAQGKTKKALVLLRKVHQTMSNLKSSDEPNQDPREISVGENIMDTSVIQTRREAEERRDSSSLRTWEILYNYDTSVLTDLKYHVQLRASDMTDSQLTALERKRRFFGKILGETDKYTLTIANKLAESYLVQGRTAEAANVLQKVVKQHQGERYELETLRAMNRLAETYQVEGKVEEAAALQENVLEMMRKQFVSDSNSDTLLTMNNLAETYRAQGQTEKAEMLQKEALEKWRLKFDKNWDWHPDVLVTTISLVATYVAQGKLEEANELHRELLTKKTHLQALSESLEAE